MHRMIGVLGLCLATAASANPTITVSKHYAPNDPWAVGVPITRYALDHLHVKALESCPSGWEKLREYTTRDGDKYFLHFEIRCLGAAPSAAK